MSLEDNKTVVRKLYEAASQHELGLLDEIMVPDYVDAALGVKSREDFKQFLTRNYGGVPDLHWEIEQIAGEGDRVWVLYNAKGTHTGEYRGLAPTGKKIVIPSVGIYRVVDGKVVENMGGVSDFLEMFKQIGVVDYIGFPGEKK
ncbi:MAG: ester cyclase [Candidatus Ranarchaeia archaeon]|jgi:predicted ester cyclase